MRLVFTPRCMYTYYQIALDRLFKKAQNKIITELDITAWMKKIRESDKLVRSFEQYEIFKGLHKKYKKAYINVINVSLDTANSIILENEDPIKPAENPY